MRMRLSAIYLGIILIAPMSNRLLSLIKNKLNVLRLY